MTSMPGAVGHSRSPNPGVGHRDRLAGADEPWRGASARSLPDDPCERGDRWLERALVYPPVAVHHARLAAAPERAHRKRHVADALAHDPRGLLAPAPVQKQACRAMTLTRSLRTKFACDTRSR